MFEIFLSSIFIIRTTFIMLSHFNFMSTPVQSLELLWEILKYPHLGSLFLRGQQAKVEVAESILLRDYKFLHHLSLHAYFLRSKSSLLSQYITNLLSTGGK